MSDHGTTHGPDDTPIGDEALAFDDLLAADAVAASVESLEPEAAAQIDPSRLDAVALEQARRAAEAERDEFRDMALRLQADFENYRKRVATQQGDEVDRATGRLAEALLPVLDACEAAFTHGASDVEPIWSALIGTLQKQGLEVLDLADQPFDPGVADAVAHEPAADGEHGPVVSEVLRTGYRWKGRVLRPAMVKVKG
jgi:molecular chaperone GrpE